MGATTYNETYTTGGTNLSTGSTWAANALVVLKNQSQFITDGLDVSTNAIDAVHIIGGAPRIASAAGGTWTVKIDNTYTTTPNFVWRAGGYSKVTFSTNACPLAIIDGGTHVIVAGTVTVLCVYSGDVTIESGATVGTLIVGGGHVTVHSAVATVIQSGGRVDADVRMGATSYTLSGGSAYIDNSSGSACTILNLEPEGKFYPLAGSVATLNRRGGFIGYNAATTSLTLGSTALLNYAGPTPTSTGYVAVSNLTDYTEYASEAA